MTRGEALKTASTLKTELNEIDSYLFRIVTEACQPEFDEDDAIEALSSVRFFLNNCLYEISCFLP